MWSFLSLRSGAFALLTVMLVAGAAVPVTAQQANDADESEAIRAMLEERDAEIKSILNGTESDFSSAQRDELMTLINGFIDFRAMGQEALGPFWSDLSEEQRAEFVDVFQGVVRHQSLSDLEAYNSEVTYDRIDVEDDSAFVRTTTRYQGNDTPVDYVLHRKDSTWLATDIILDEVSTAGGYARSFQNVMRKRGFDALMNSLRTRLDRAEQEANAQ
ncbi:MAG: ABC transporter substrate-binding protein [Longimonas sp.]|uniref:MlaC/ttg2D family ABC transporter substrate-binding protein n=1 Tax=Longimonas sp. TaxID=2039626 RepID=UPI00397637D1